MVILFELLAASLLRALRPSFFRFSFISLSEMSLSLSILQNNLTRGDTIDIDPGVASGAALLRIADANSADESGVDGLG
jgi:hypothetical protein